MNPIIIVVNGGDTSPESLAKITASIREQFGNGNYTPVRPISQTITLKDAIERMLEAKTAGGRRPSTIKSLRRYLAVFMKGRQSRHVHEFGLSDVDSWFAGRKESLSGRKSNEGRLSSLFSWCVRKGYMAENPCRRLDQITLDRKPVTVLTVRQAAKLLIAAKRRKPCSLAFFTLAMLAGVRPQELQQVSWSDIDLEAGRVTISAAASKVRRRRVVHLMPSALAWLKKAKELSATLPVSRMSRRRYTRDFACETLGLERFPQDILRHTAATFWLAHCRDAYKVAHELGNSVGILAQHYTELVPEADAKRFWEILPREKPMHLVNGWRSWHFALGRAERKKRRLERVRAAMAAYRSANPEKIRAQRAAYRSKHRDRIAAQRREHFIRNREKLYASKRDYCARNREKVRAADRARWARRRDKLQRLALKEAA